MASELTGKHCVACKGGTPTLKGEELKPYAAQVPEWTIVAEHSLERVFKFSDFRTALAFVNRVGELAEAEWHHPDIELAWGRAAIKTWTHKVDGLTENDFILAAKIDALPTQ